MRITRRLTALLAAAAVGVFTGPLSAPAAAQVGRDLPGRLPAGVVVDASAPPLPADLTATAWTVADLDTGEVLAARDAHAEHAPASTLKVLTAYALLPQVPAEQVVVPQQSDVDVEGSKVGLLPDVAYPAEELYAALLMVSGNDTANALGTAAGGPAAAAATMNRAARDLGAVDTMAVNQHGLDADGQVSTPYDLAVITRAALEVPHIARWVATRRSSMSGRPGEPRFETANHNRLLGGYDGALGVKNGYTSQARASFIGAAERDGRRLVVTLMRAEPRVWAEAGHLLDWGFAASAAGVPPVGALPPVPAVDQPTAAQDAPGTVPDTAAASSEEASAKTSGGTPDEAPVEAAVERTGTQLTPAAALESSLPGRELAGALLAAAALLAVRPTAARRSGPRTSRASGRG